MFRPADTNNHHAANMNTPEPNDDAAARNLWRRRKSAAPQSPADAEANADALEKFLAQPEAADEETLARLLADDPALLELTVAAHTRAESAPVPADALARAKALASSPVREPRISLLAALREWLAAQFTLPAVVRDLAFATALALVCAVGFFSGQRNQPPGAGEVAIVPAELFGGGEAFDVNTLLSMGGGQ